jgi:uncharacterized protein YndB with AHSA1/START domain
MGKAFELTYEQEVEATPDEVWQAISTGDGLDAWFMGRNTVEPREGGTATFEVAGGTEESTVTVWQPPARLVTVGNEAPDGSQHTFDYQIEPRGSRTAIRWLHKGFLGSEHWEAEYEGMSEGDPVYFAKLAEYLTYFKGRIATPVNVFHPGPADKAEAWATYQRAFGLAGDVAADDRVTLTPEGLPRIEGVVDVRTETFLGVRTDDAMYRFMHVDWAQIVGLGHHLFAEGLDQAEIEGRWAAWLTRTFPTAG